MKATLHRADLEPQHLGDFLGAQPLDVAQDQDFAVRRVERADGGRERLLELGPGHLLVGRPDQRVL